jgi:phospholipid/cholesterol/gamma-HCH transport system substrate-binding protein
VRTWLVGLIALVVVTVVTLLGFTKDIPFVNQPYQLNAAFRDASGINPGSPVRVAGVTIGEVTKVEHTEPGSESVTVTMDIRERGRPIREDAHARIRPRIFLEGNFFVDLEPGTPQAGEMADGGTIPSSRTDNPVQVGEILRALKSDTRRSLKLTLKGLGDAQAAGAGRAFNDTLPFQAPAYKYSAIVSEALLGRQPGDLGRWIRDGGVVAGALSENRQQLRALVTDFNATAAALADRDQELRRVIAALPGTLEQGMLAFDDLNAAFPNLRRFAAAARPAVRSTTGAVDATVPLLAQLRGLVRENELRGLARDLRRSVGPLTRVAEESVPLLEQGRELAGCTADVLVPWGNDRVPDPNFPATGPVHEELAKPFPALAGESRSFDANGQWFKVLGTGGLETFDLGNGLFGTATDPNLGVRPGPVRERPPLRPNVPCETQETPDLEAQAGTPPRAIDTDSDSTDVLERAEKVRALATAVLQAQLRQRGDDTVVRDENITPDELRALAGGAGG